MSNSFELKIFKNLGDYPVYISRKDSEPRIVPRTKRIQGLYSLFLVRYSMTRVFL